MHTHMPHCDEDTFLWTTLVDGREIQGLSRGAGHILVEFCDSHKCVNTVNDFTDSMSCNPVLREKSRNGTSYAESQMWPMWPMCTYCTYSSYQHINTCWQFQGTLYDETYIWTLTCCISSYLLSVEKSAWLHRVVQGVRLTPKDGNKIKEVPLLF